MKVEDRSVDQVFKLLGNRRRRRIIGYLHETVDNSATFDELVDSVVEDETNSPRPDEHSVAADLHHVHLPMLDDVGIGDYDARTKTVRYHGHSHIEQLEDALPESDYRGEASNR